MKGESMNKKIHTVGITEMVIPCHAYPIFKGRKLLQKGRPDKVWTLPSKPKWVVSDGGNIAKIPDADIFQYLPVFELAVNPNVEKTNVGLYMKKWHLGKGFIADFAKFLLCEAERRLDEEMLRKCKWVCKIYRQLPIVMPIKSTTKVEASAYEHLAMFGG